MRDLVAVLMGRSRCGWCEIRSTTRIERFFGGDNYDRAKWWQRPYWAVAVRSWPADRLARRIHDRLHT